MQFPSRHGRPSLPLLGLLQCCAFTCTCTAAMLVASVLHSSSGQPKQPRATREKKGQVQMRRTRGSLSKVCLDYLDTNYDRRRNGCRRVSIKTR